MRRRRRVAPHDTELFFPAAKLLQTSSQVSLRSIAVGIITAVSVDSESRKPRCLQSCKMSKSWDRRASELSHTFPVRVMRSQHVKLGIGTRERWKEGLTGWVTSEVSHAVVVNPIPHDFAATTSPRGPRTETEYLSPL